METLQALYTTTSGRLSRKQWWLGVVGLIFASIVLSLVLGFVTGAFFASIIAYVLLFYPSWCLGIKRRQDRGNDAKDFKIFMGFSAFVTLLQAAGLGFTMTDVGNGVMVPMPEMWMNVLMAILAVGGIYMLVQLGFLRGTPGTNNYGPDPLTTPATA